MRIAVAATDKNEDGKVSSRGARAPFFLIYDEAGKVVEVLANPFGQQERAVGLRMADYLSDKGIDAVVAGHFGTNFANALSAKGILFFEMRVNIRDAAADVSLRPG